MLLRCAVDHLDGSIAKRRFVESGQTRVEGSRFHDRGRAVNDVAQRSDLVLRAGLQVVTPTARRLRRGDGGHRLLDPVQVVAGRPIDELLNVRLERTQRRRREAIPIDRRNSLGRQPATTRRKHELQGHNSDGNIERKTWAKRAICSESKIQLNHESAHCRATPRRLRPPASSRCCTCAGTEIDGCVISTRYKPGRMRPVTCGAFSGRCSSSILSVQCRRCRSCLSHSGR